LFFDAPESSFRNISLWVYNRNPSRLDGMLELLVASGLRNLEPAVVFEPSNDFPAVHRGAPFHLKNTHFVYTLQQEETLQEEQPMIECAVAFANGDP